MAFCHSEGVLLCRTTEESLKALPLNQVQGQSDKENNIMEFPPISMYRHPGFAIFDKKQEYGVCLIFEIIIS